MASRDTTRWAIIGAGNIAAKFADDLKGVPNAVLCAVCSRNISSATAFAQKHSGTRPYSDHNEMLHTEGTDVVYIATPNPSHKELALDCIEAGKAVLVEKPFALNANEASMIINRAREKGVFCMEAMWMRFIPMMQKIRSLLEQNLIGEIQVVNANIGFQAPLDPDNRFFSLRLGGGALLDLGVYALNLAIWLLGEPDTIESHAHIGATGVDERAGVVLGYRQGPMAVLSTSNRTVCENRAAIFGTHGAIVIHEPFFHPTSMSLVQIPEVRAHGAIRRKVRQVEVLRKIGSRAKRIITCLRGDSIHVPYTGNGYGYEAAEVQRCIRAGVLESNIMPLGDTMSVMAAMDTIRDSWGLRYPQELGS